MVAILPKQIEDAGLKRFTDAAKQLEKSQPIVSYWCEYFVLERIFSQKLHTADEECSNYTDKLMDRVEEKKAKNTTTEEIIDPIKAKEYIKDFALKAFQRAEPSLRANKVTKSTGANFYVAGISWDLLSMWGEVAKDIIKKRIFAKAQASRILLAIQEGRDPNASNPVFEETPAPTDVDLEAELEALVRTVNEAPVESDDQVAPVSSLPSAVPANLDDMAGNKTVESPEQTLLPRPQHDQASAVSPGDSGPPRSVRQSSLGGGYFPTVPTLPYSGDADAGAGMPSVDPAQPPPITQQPQGQLSPHSFYGVESTPSPFVPLSQRSHDNSQISGNLQDPTVPATAPEPAPQSNYINSALSSSSAAPAASYRTDDDATMAAQKHAKFAISALNFEDVNTAVKELRQALQSLGAL